MSYFFLLNAVVLLLLGVYTCWRKRDALSLQFLVLNLGLALWNLSIFLLEGYREVFDVNLASQLQLFSALIFTNGFYSFTRSYPPPRERGGRIAPRLAAARIRRPHLINGLLTFVFTLLIFFSDFVSRAELDEGNVVFIDGLGYLLYSAYLMILSALTLTNLISAYRRYPDYRSRIAYMLTGLALFLFFAIVFDLVLPLLGNYELLYVGHFSSIFPPLFFAYAITKHDLLDLRVTVQRNTARILVILFTLLSFGFAWQLILELNWSSGPEGYRSALLLLCLLGLFWGQLSHRIEQFLVTTARRKFVRGWYEPEDILNRLAGRLEREENRLDIFRQVTTELDLTFEPEELRFVVAHRDRTDQLQDYGLYSSESSAALRSVVPDEPFLEACREKGTIFVPGEITGQARSWLDQLGHAGAGEALIIPFFSPDMLEGVLILGERSGGVAYSGKDRLFLGRLVSYVSALLYRLTPFEKLERLYFENQKRLHEAEIQLIRAEKTRAIAHATRQAHHEIRTPLSIIRLSARRIRDMESVEKHRQITENQIDRAMEIIGETLAITDGSEVGQARHTVVDLNQVLKRCIRLLPDFDHEVVMQLQENLPAIDGVASELQVLFTNLIKNGLEAMPQPGVLTLRSYVERGQAVVTVRDTGVGVPAELREKIWEPYFSGKVTAAGNLTAGRGWGLTITHRIVTEHKGTIQLESHAGQGSCFMVRLPLRAP